MKLKPFYLLFFVLLSGLFFTTSCKRDKFLTEGGNLSFSTDTLTFDTVFTSIGSVTNSFKIYNNENKRIKIKEIKLLGGEASPYRMNIDGVPTKNINDIEIAPNDSIYVFVAVTVDPTSGNLPFLVEEKVMITLNENQFEVPIRAYGQDAHYIVDSVLTSNTWINDKPYVIINSALVDSGEVLTIQKGCRIYMHQNSKLFVDGTLRVYGTKKDSVVFQGDRLDRSYFGYRDFPAEWGGLVFLKNSHHNHLSYCVIKNAGFNTGLGYPAAIQLEPPRTPLDWPMLELYQSVVYNSGGYGIIGRSANLRMINSLVYACNLQCLAMVQGGEYDINYSTIVNYGGYAVNHAQEPTLVAINFLESEPNVFIGSDLKATFNNCIIYGSIEDELAFNKLDNWNYSMVFNHCLLKRKTAFQNYVALNNCIVNQDPEFINYGKNDFHPETTSPAKNAGLYIPYYPYDLDGNLRSTTTPSMGCYEIQ